MRYFWRHNVSIIPLILHFGMSAKIFLYKTMVKLVGRPTERRYTANAFEKETLSGFTTVTGGLIFKMATFFFLFL